MRTITVSLLLLGLVCLAPALALAAARVTTAHVEAELLAETDGVAPGQTLTVALRQKLEPGWHTYWKNAGDSGEPAHLEWALPEGAQAGEIVWPAPEEFQLKPFVTFGYSGEPWLLTEIKVPFDLTPGSRARIGLAASWLVCADTCVPEDARFELELPVLKNAPPINERSREGFARARAALPVPLTSPAKFAISGKTVTVTLADPALSSVKNPHLFPEVSGIVSTHTRQTIRARSNELTISAKGGARVIDETARETVSHLPAVLVATGRTGQRVAYSFTATRDDASGPAAASGLPLGLALLFALAGGAILNLMPCVFPVLSMKALSLMRDTDVQAARREGLAYAAGVVFTFLALAGVLLALRATGTAVGWGFHLQSPAFVGGLALLFVAIGLNLIGAFDLRGIAVSAPGRAHHPLLRDALMGVLAVMVASPCTAPFMAAALGVALTLPAGPALAIFASLGIGMAAPYVAVTSIPWLRRRVPRPGPWMTLLRELLAFPMFGAAVWLGWVLSREAGPTGTGLLGLAILFLALAAWAWKRAETSTARGFRPAALVACALALACLVPLAWTPTAEPFAAGVAPDEEPYSAARLEARLAEGRPVFVNATAAWCITCQWNESRTLSSQRIRREMRERGVVWMTADWTLRAPEITALLESHGRSGVPLYLLVVPGKPAHIFPQLLPEKALLTALNDLPKLTDISFQD